jgi:mannose-1-phosphate guanylyltransferase
MSTEMDFRAVIMAGGIGTRFWPLSRRKTPKQFLPIISEKTMIEETANRLLPWVPHSKIFTIADSVQTKGIRQFLPEIPKANMIVEPKGRNTAPSLILATAHIYLQNPEAVIAALPADHLIKDKHRFLKKLQSGASAAAQGAHLITFGIPPAHPSTGYGYIHFSKEKPANYGGDQFFSVIRFEEKPPYKRACSFLESGDYFWNSGMFLWRASVFVDKLEKHAPEMFVFWKKILAAIKKNDEQALTTIFNEITARSIDYALMERAQGVIVCQGDFGWSDVGSWSALPDIWGVDKQNNSHRGECLSLDSENCLVLNPDKLTALVGVKDLIIVDTEDALLICRKDLDQKVKDIVIKLNKSGRTDLL